MKKKERRYYSDEFKWKVIQEVISGKFTKEEAKRLYGIGGNSAILYWMRKLEGIDKYPKPSIKKAVIIETMKLKSEQEIRIEELEKQLERERIRGDLWKKAVELAEEQLNIDIRKKYGAKQSIPSKKKKSNK